MNFRLFHDKDDDPVIINVDDIKAITIAGIGGKRYSCIRISDGVTYYIMEDISDIYQLIMKGDSNQPYNALADPIMQNPKPKITRWEKFWKSVDPDKYREYICDAVECIECPAFGRSCLDTKQFKAYMLEEVDDDTAR